MPAKTSTMKPKTLPEETKRETGNRIHEELLNAPPNGKLDGVVINTKGARTGRVSGPTLSNPPKPDPLPVDAKSAPPVVDTATAAEDLLWLHTRAADVGMTINDYIAECVDSIVIYERYIGRVDGLESGGPHGEGK